MTFSLRRKRPITRRAKSTPSRTGCRLLAAAVVLALAGSASAQTKSTFVPRADGPPAELAAPVMAVQAKTPAEKTPLDKAPLTLPGEKERTKADPYEAYIRLEPPGRERLFGSRDTERELEERMRQERKDQGPSQDNVVFPVKPELTGEPYQPRKFAAAVILAEPNYIVYRRLYFEEKNSERYGWDLGPIQPLVSTLAFLKDAVMLPHNFFAYPCRRFETNAGQCQPGDPVPYLCYPPEITWSGVLAEVSAIGMLIAIVP
jgi:hypothetical protein